MLLSMIRRFQYVPNYVQASDWGALKKAWLQYKEAKARGDREQAEKYANLIRELQIRAGPPAQNGPLAVKIV